MARICSIPNSTASNTNHKLSTLSSYLGVLETLVTDKGSQFPAQSFKHFCSINGITHLCSPLYHAQSNGQAERFADTFKRALLKGEGDGITRQVITKFLTAYRTTPNSTVSDEKSPAEAMIGRSTALFSTPCCHPK